jgi:CheY-like chemotaxis protein
MRWNRQIKGNTQVGFSYTKTYVPEGAGYRPLRVGGWRSILTSDIPQWISDRDGRFAGTNGEKQKAAGQPSPPRLVLHIDDDEEDRMLLEEALQKLDANIKVQQVDSGKAALSFLKQAREAGHLPCLIILDINMPGMNGKEVLKEIKKDRELAPLPLILFTTSSASTYSDLIQEENVELISKPLSPAELIDSAREMLKHCPPG